MQTINIKSGTSASFAITPKIGDAAATADQLSGVTIYVFFVYQFTNKVYGTPYALTSNNLTINLTPEQTVTMLGSAEENQKFDIQFAIKDSEGNILAESGENGSGLTINIIRWEAGLWLQNYQA